jgi:hypothetical protein
VATAGQVINHPQKSSSQRKLGSICFPIQINMDPSFRWDDEVRGRRTFARGKLSLDGGVSRESEVSRDDEVAGRICEKMQYDEAAG